MSVDVERRRQRWLRWQDHRAELQRQCGGAGCEAIPAENGTECLARGWFQPEHTLRLDEQRKRRRVRSSFRNLFFHPVRERTRIHQRLT